jgi:murein endopeptidase
VRVALSATSVAVALVAVSLLAEAPGPSAQPRVVPRSLPPASFTLVPMRDAALPFEEEAFPFLAGEDPGSVSFGTVTDGALFGATELFLPGQHFSILPIQLARNLRYGSDELVEVLLYGAAQVAEQFPGTITWFGNLGRQQGGDIPYSVSHNSGRDADVAFFYLDDAGDPIDPPDLLPLGPQLVATHEGVRYHLDAARTWAFAEALLTHPEAQVQFLFVSNPIRRELLAYARAHGADREVIRRAEAVMSQPGRSNPHDDHLHVRLYCTEEDVGAGCENGGRTHAWVDLFEGARGAAVRRAAQQLEASEAAQRAAAASRLAFLGETASRDELAALLADPDAGVRVAAARALGRLGRAGDAHLVLSAWSIESDAEALAAYVVALGRLGGAEAGAFLVEQLAAPRELELRGVRIDLRALVVEALAELAWAPALTPMLELLGEPDPLLRARTSWALARLTNRSTPGAWGDPGLSAAALREMGEKWRSWLALYEQEPRSRWLELGYRADGYLPSGANGAFESGDVARAVSSRTAYVSNNAQRSLAAARNVSTPTLTWPRVDAAWFWRR